MPPPAKLVKAMEKRGWHYDGGISFIREPKSWAELESWLDKLEKKACNVCGLGLEQAPGWVKANHLEQCDKGGDTLEVNYNGTIADSRPGNS